MSRIGKLPVTVPSGVTVSIAGSTVTAKGKLGELSVTLTDDIAIEQADGKITVTPRSQHKRAKQMWATGRTLVNNIVTGVSQGFTRKLEINGVGYRAEVKGKDLVLSLGFSHPVNFPIPEGISVKCPKPTEIELSGADKQALGQVAAEIRAWRPPEPFKGKGVKYAEERILRKEGKKK